MNRLLLAIFSFAAAVALAAGPRTGKLIGHVEIGPLSPVQRPGHDPKPSPEMYARYHVLVTKAGPQGGEMKSQLRVVVAKLKLTDSGDFSTDLVAGTYQVSVVPKQMGMHPPVVKEVTVATGKTTKVVLKVDTGIR
jgi:hypothetical protein